MKERETKPLQFDEFENWLNSRYEHASKIIDNHKTALLFTEDEEILQQAAKSLWKDIIGFAENNQTENDCENVEIFCLDYCSLLFSQTLP